MNDDYLWLFVEELQHELRSRGLAYAIESARQRAHARDDARFYAEHNNSEPPC